MALATGTYRRETYYYISSELPPIVSSSNLNVQNIVGIDSTISMQYMYPRNIGDIMPIIPLHMTFLGWYSPDTNTTINMNEEKYFDVSNVTISSPFILYAKWEINTKFNYKETTLFDFSQGNVNVTPETLAKGVTAYNADGILITGTREDDNAAGDIQPQEVE